MVVGFQTCAVWEGFSEPCATGTITWRCVVVGDFAGFSAVCYVGFTVIAEDLVAKDQDFGW